MLKSYGVVVGCGGALEQLSVSLRPLGFGFGGFWVSGLRVWGQGLTINVYFDCAAKHIL